MSNQPSICYLIPRSSLSVACNQKKNGNWSIKLVNNETLYEKQIDKDLTGEQMIATSMFLINCGKQVGFFGKNFKDVITALRKQIKTIKSPKDKNICLNTKSTSERSTLATSL